jgi:A/G-specific adenine glycosylase
METGDIKRLPTINQRRDAVLGWYERHGRHHLPWRANVTPYRVLVSEIMLQQTQVDRVIPYFEKWMKRWPTVASLARARRSSVIRAWAGLGYNRRSVALHGAAQSIASLGWPRSDAAALASLPGIGPYTANALLTFAWNIPAPSVDTNVRRVLTYTIFKRPSMRMLSQSEMMRHAARVIPDGHSRDWHAALMDYGALVQTARMVPRDARRASVPFRGSSRFWRGRIVDVLRGSKQPISRTRLSKELRTHGDAPALPPLLHALETEGIIRQNQGDVQLA